MVKCLSLAQSDHRAAGGLRAGSPTAANQLEARNGVGIVLVSRTATGKPLTLFILPAI